MRIEASEGMKIVVLDKDETVMVTTEGQYLLRGVFLNSEDGNKINVSCSGEILNNSEISIKGKKIKVK
jgi:hypothetical protein